MRDRPVKAILTGTMIPAPATTFKRVGGHPVADFVNTVGGRVADRRRRGHDLRDRIVSERLDRLGTLLRWAAEGGLLTATEVRRLGRTPPAAAAAVLNRAIELREAVYRLFKARIEGWPPRPADLKTLAAVAAEAHQTQILRFESLRPVWAWPAAAGPRRILWSLALASVDLLGSEDAARIRQCPGERCGWLFVDTSRNGSRLWCDMADCGNLAKVRRFRTRRTGAGR